MRYSRLKKAYPSWLNNYSPIELLNMIPVKIVFDNWEVKEYSNLQIAKQEYPELDPYSSTNSFTWGMRDTCSTGEECIRFEGWSANESLSI